MRMQRFVFGYLFVCLLGFPVISLPATAQTTAPNEWTWVGGGNAVNQSGVYGQLGTAAAGNIPGGRDSAVNWTDNSGNFWLFGGIGYDAKGNSGELNDLWEFSPSTNEWTWIGGNSNVGGNCVTVNNPINGTSTTYCGQPGIYGALGKPDAGNIPGGRYGAVSWTDGSGNFWLFGGSGFDSTGAFGYLNDLWEFTPSTHTWTWISGSSVVNQPGVYGSLGKPATGNVPGARYEANSWIDGSGSLWLYGGTGGTGDLNDLWSFNTSTSQWTWMNGSSAVGQNGTYGTIGTPAAGDTPNSRSGAVSWTDDSGNFWLMGGEGYSSTSQRTPSLVPSTHPLEIIFTNNPPIQYGDLWEFDIAAKEWVLVSLDALNNVPGTLGVPSAANGPSAGVGSIAYTDKSGIVWVFSPSSYFYTECNNLMDFNPSTSEWAWMGGSCSFLGAYGTEGIPDAGNIPGGRADSVGWTDSQGNFWLFGGHVYDPTGNSGELNDLWEYQPSANTLPPAITPTFNVASGGNDFPFSFTVYNGMSNSVFYYTTDGTTPTTNSLETTGPITLSSPATVKVIAVANGYPNSGVAMATFTQEPTTETPTLSLLSGTYTTIQMVTISDATPNANIEYSLNQPGDTNLYMRSYSGPVEISTTETLTAIATAIGFNNSAYATATYTIPPDFALAINPTAISVQGGQRGAATITATDVGGFSGFNSPVTFACTGLPAGAVCSFSTLTVPTPAGTSYSMLTVTTAATAAALHRDSSPLFPGSVLAVAFCCFGWKKRRGLPMLLLLAAISVASLTALNGCGGASNTVSTPPPVSSTVTVTATSGSLTHTTTFTLTVY